MGKFLKFLSHFFRKAFLFYNCDMRYFKSALIWLPSIFFLIIIAVIGYYVYQAGLEIGAVIIMVWYFINLIITQIIFIQKRNESAKLSWFFVINILPLIGHIVFLVFGQRYANRKEHKKYQKSYGFSHEKKLPIPLNYSNNVRSLLQKQSAMSKRGIYDANFELFKSGDVAYEAMFQDMQKAQKFIHIQFYIIKPGEIYEHFKSLLLTKAREGVKIRFIVDDFGRWAMPAYEIRQLRQEGIEIAIFGRVNFPFIGSENGYRTHRKMVIIDGQIVHTGGVNIADEYASLDPKYGVWIDFQARVTGALVRSYSLLFAQDWFLVQKETLDLKKLLLEKSTTQSHGILIEDSPENKEAILEHSIVQMILNARSEIHLATPYFIPSAQLLAALKTAALSGIKIYLYIPGRPDKKIVLAATHFYVNKLQEYGAIIYETRNMMFHSKMALFDQEYAYFGTANLDVRSFYSQFEIINLVVGQGTKEIADFFAYYRKLARQIAPGEFKAVGTKEKLKRIFVNLLSPIM